jgi:ribose transport system substrate-binding protein
MPRRMSVLSKLFLMLMVIGCGSDDTASDSLNDSDDSEEKVAWLVRNEVPDNEFKPLKIETVLDNLVSALNETEQDATMQLSFIPKKSTGYFQTIIEGANDAFDELGTANSIVAPNADLDDEAQRDQQIEYLQQNIQDGYSGAGLASMDIDLVPTIDEAVAEGMAIVTFDSDEPTSKRHLYVGTIDTEAGKTAGETLVDLIGDNIGTVVILGNDDPDLIDGYDRTHEARKVLEDAGLTVIVHHTDGEDQDANEAAIQETMATADPPAVGCLGVFSNSYLCATAAEAAGVIEDIKIAAFDFEPETLELMREGKIQATHVQRQYYMGYIIPYLLYAINALGIDDTKAIVSYLMVDESRLDTGLDVISADQIDAYNDFLDSLGI